MLKDFYPVRWAGGQAVVALPEHIGVSNAGQVRDGLLSVINLGATTLIADMTATVSCDHAGADAMIRAWQRAVSSGTELRLVVTARSVSQVLGLRGLDRQVSVYPSLEAATAARLPAAAAVLAAARPRRPGQSRGGPGAAPVPPAGLLEEPRDVSGTGRLDDLAGLARDAAAAQQEHLRLLDAVITGLFHTGLSLQAAAGLPGDGAGQHVEAALGELDDIIRLIRSAAFAGRARPGPPPPRASGNAW